MNATKPPDLSDYVPLRAAERVTGLSFYRITKLIDAGLVGTISLPGVKRLVNIQDVRRVAARHTRPPGRQVWEACQ